MKLPSVVLSPTPTFQLSSYLSPSTEALSPSDLIRPRELVKEKGGSGRQLLQADIQPSPWACAPIHVSGKMKDVPACFTLSPSRRAFVLLPSVSFREPVWGAAAEVHVAGLRGKEAGSCALPGPLPVLPATSHKPSPLGCGQLQGRARKTFICSVLFFSSDRSVPSLFIGLKPRYDNRGQS